MQPHGLYSLWNSLGQNTGLDSLPLLQGIFPTQGTNPGLLHCRWILYQLSYQGSILVHLSCFLFFKFFYQNIVDNNVVVISSVQPSDSVIHTYTYIYILFPILFPNRLLQNIESSP